MMRRPRRRGLGRVLAEDDGSTLPLIIGATGLALAVVLVVAGAASLYLEHKRLLGLADSAARVGAEAFDLEDVQVTADGELRLALDPARVEAEVAAFLGTQPADFEALRLLAAGSPDARSAVVTLAAWWRPPLVGGVLPEGLPIEVTATARTVFH